MLKELSTYGNTELLSILVAALNDDGYYISQKGTRVYGIVNNDVEAVSLYNVDEDDPNCIVEKPVNKNLILFYTIDDDFYIMLGFIDDEYIIGSLKDHPMILPDLDSLGEYNEEKIRYEASFEMLDTHTEVVVHVSDRKEGREFNVIMESNFDTMFSMVHGVSTVVKKEDDINNCLNTIGGDNCDK